MFAVPKVGETVSFKVCYPALNQSGEHINVKVVRPFPWLTTYEFCVEVEEDDPIRSTGFTTRVIHMRNVVELNGKKVDQVDTSEKKVEVAGSKKGSYTVLVRGGIGTECSCTGFKFRKSCRHLKEAEGLVK